MTVRVLIVDDHEPVRRGIRSLLAHRQDWTVCGEAADGLEAVEMARQFRPDVILMDMSMPRMDGAEATRIIRRELANAKVIVVSQNDFAVVNRQAAEVQAHACVEKAHLSRDLIHAIEKVLNIQRAEDLPPFPSDSTTEQLPWLQEGGEMGSLMRATDWSKTALGPGQFWSPALRMIVKFLLANRFPQLLWWGPRFCCLYNDAYVPVLGEKHPWALGRPVAEVWREIWHVLKPLVETPYLGGPATWMEDIPLEINRRGFFEETHFTIAYSPVPDESVPGGIGGVLATVHEITEKVIGERRVSLLRDLGARSVEPKSVEEACALAAEILSRHSKDVPFALFYLFDSKQEEARLISAAGVDRNDRGCPETVSLSSGSNQQIWPLANVLKTETIELVHDLSSRFQVLPVGDWPDPPTAAAVVPVRSNIAHQLAGFMIVGLSARIRFDQKYNDFLELLSTQFATTIANARAYNVERKRAEELAELDRAKTLFFSNLSHEFRTPLTLMLAPLEDALAHDNSLPAEHRERLQMAHRNSLRLLKLVNNLLDFSRIEAGRIEASYEPTDLPTFTAEMASVFRSATERAGVRLLINCPPLPEPVYVDREMWEKIVFNLLSNAFKFTFSGEIEVSLQSRDGFAELSVRDTGTGIPQDELPHLFERFYRVKDARGRTFEGSGIGLALVQELAKLHCGTIRVQSEVNRGSIFTVSVPLGRDHLPADRVGAGQKLESTELHGDAYLQEALRWLPGTGALSDEVPAAALRSAPDLHPHPKPDAGLPARILLADDNADLRQYVQNLLRNRFEVISVADGEAALHSARLHRPDLILSDIMMPKLDGFALLQAVRADEQLKEIPVILLSARAGEESRIEGLESGADDYLVKPFSARELLARVRSHLSMARIRKQHEEALARRTEAAADSERRLRLAAEAAELGVWQWYFDQPASIWENDRMYEIYGRSPQDGPISNLEFYEKFAHPADVAPLQQALENSLQNGTRFFAQCRVYRTDGQLRHLEYTGQIDRRPDGSPFRMLGTVLDVTDRNAAERSNTLLAAIVGSSDDAIVSKSLNGVITSWNRGAERMFGYTAEEAVGQNITLIIPADRVDEEREILARLRRGESIDHFETVRKRKDGSLLDISVTISPIKDSTGRITGASKVARDITERKRAEENYRNLAETLEIEVRARTSELEERTLEVVQQSERLRELSWRLLNTQDNERRHIARELHDSAGQTLAVLSMNIARLLETIRHHSPQAAELTEQTQELVQQLTQEIRTTSYLLHPPLLDETGIGPAIRWYIDGLRQRSNLEIQLDIPDNFERLPRDIELVIFRTIQEGLTNIHRHSGSKTAVLRISRDSASVTIELRDFGKGIPPEKLVEIQSRGSGVGIRGMRERVLQFAGNVTIDSDSSGTRVLVTIPVPAQSADTRINNFQAAV